MKKIYAVVFALMVLFMMGMSAVALESKVIYRENGMSAHAFWSETTDSVSTDTFLSVMESKDGTDIYVDICTYDENEWSCKGGYMFTEEDVFDMDKKLEFATLSPVEIEVYDWTTGAVETLTIQAQWIGVGDITKDSNKYMSKNNDFMQKFSDTSTFREATVTGSKEDEKEDVQDLGNSEFGYLVKFKSSSMYMEK
jgi:hypothetical protein